MNTTTWQGILIVAALAAAPVGASPLHIGGTFSGVGVSVTGLPLNFPPPHPLSYYEGAPVTGSFEVFVPNPQPVPWRDDGFYNQDGWLSLAFTVRDETFTYYVGSPELGYPSVIEMTPSVEGGPQSVSFSTFWIRSYGGASLGLIGPEGSLFDGLDPTTLHFDPTRQPRMVASLIDSRTTLSMGVDVQQFTMHALNEVPEPSTYALILLGLALLAAPHVEGAKFGRWRGPGPAAAWRLSVERLYRAGGKP